MLHKLETVHVGHFNVGQDDAGHAMLADFLDGIQTVLGQNALEAFAEKKLLGNTTHRERIVHHQHGNIRANFGFDFRIEQKSLLDNGTLHAVAQGHGIDNQQRSTIARHGRTHETRKCRNRTAKRLHDQIAVRIQGIDMDRNRLIVIGYQQHAVVAHNVVAPVSGNFGEAVERDGFAVLVEFARGIGLFNQNIPHYDNVLHQGCGHRVRHGIGAYGHHGDDGHVGRHNQFKASSFAGLGMHVDTSAHGGNFTLHHVHANAAPGQCGNRVGRRKAGVENQRVGFFLRDGFIRAQQAFFASFPLHGLAVDTVSVIAQLKHNIVPTKIDFKRHDTDIGFADFQAFGGGLNAMRNRIAYQMLQRGNDFVQYTRVDIQLVFEYQLRLLVGLTAGLPHQTVQATFYGGDRHRTYGHHRMLHIVRDVRVFGHGVLNVNQVSYDFGLAVVDVVHCFSRHPRQFLQTRETVELQGVKRRSFFLCLSHARLHLRFGLNFHIFQQSAQPIQVGCHFMDLLFHVYNGGFHLELDHAGFAQLIGQGIHF